MIGIVDYGMGNLHSVSKALERLDYDYFISEDQATLATADALILPGVGSFKDAMAALKSEMLDQFLTGWANAGKPLLGICLGMQLLYEHSEENGLTAGLALLKGKVRRFSGTTAEGIPYKVPHMGWNKLRYDQDDHELVQNVESGHVYFVHSYVVQDFQDEELIASSNYGGVVPAVVGKGNVFGTQFHPEKSSDVGMSILRNYAAVVTRQKEGINNG